MARMNCSCHREKCSLPAGDPRHGSEYGYTRFKCGCSSCTSASAEAHRRRRASSNSYREQRARRIQHERRKEAPSLGKPLSEVLRAGRLLEDGASYAEVARSVGWDAKTVARHFPGRGWARDECLDLARAVRGVSA